MKIDVFESCANINNLLLNNNENEARNELIKLLDVCKQNNIEYNELINYLIREVGLYPYMDFETSSWQEQYVYNAFKVNVGTDEELTLHREQSLLLQKLLNGKNIAVSASTSFGKSFIIDAFIAIKKPKNVVVIVPTIALTDETRRRLYKKFAKEYKIITMPDAELADKNILIFPQERALTYINTIEEIDILIVDEFYKAEFDDEGRTSALLKVILELGKKSKQKYYLSPNISSIAKDNQFTKDMEFIPIDFNTVFLEQNERYKESEVDKNKELLEILKKYSSKTLIYCGTYNNIDIVSQYLNREIPQKNDTLLDSFSDWLIKNYSKNYTLAELSKKGIGIHNGKLHRSLSQIQISLFEEKKGLDSIISTSSIIEGINTSAENIILWANKDGRPKLNIFKYKNIIGRGGRMFKHFIGKVFLLEKPPEEKPIELTLPFPEELLSSIDEAKFEQDLTREQIKKIKVLEEEMDNLLGEKVYKKLIKQHALQTMDHELHRDIITDMQNNSKEWNGLAYIVSSDVDNWDRMLYKLLKFCGGAVGTEYVNMVSYIKAISNNWSKPIPDILSSFNNLSTEKYFHFEKFVTFNFAALLNDVNVLQKYCLRENNVDISPFVFKLSNAFLPKIVYALEEYGLPRMISRKIQNSNIINFEDENLTIHDVIVKFNGIGFEIMKSKIQDIHPFETYILEYFYNGITANN
ncbi:MAG: DEAD/DEAH box helicase [Endomicrobia bacterium]|nr:DEAD/DEAH box helicase [Endomicrobiia bacterium]MCL2506952.1 DEAD/DEAH box helicase [Endomicrobiia bacterium]